MLVWGRGQFALGKKGQDIVWRPSLLVLALPLPCVTLSESLQLRSLLSWSVCGLERNFQTEGRMRRDAIRTVDWLKGDLTPFMASVQFSCSVVSDSLQPHESQHARPPCPSPSPGVHSDSRPLSPWCHPAFSSSVVPFSSCPQSLPAWESFPMSQLFAWGGQSTGALALTSFLPKKSQGGSPSESSQCLQPQDKEKFLLEGWY